MYVFIAKFNVMTILCRVYDLHGTASDIHVFRLRRLIRLVMDVQSRRHEVFAEPSTPEFLARSSFNERVPDQAGWIGCGREGLFGEGIP